MLDLSQGIDLVSVSGSNSIKEKMFWSPKWEIKKYKNQGDYDNGIISETLEIPGNLLLNEGINTLLKLLVGGSATAYNNANARIGVGNSTTAEAATQTGLQAASDYQLYVGMNAGYPTVENQTVNFASTFGSSQANWQWNEITVENSSAAALSLNRKVFNGGTKTSPAVWSVTLSITIS